MKHLSVHSPVLPDKKPQSLNNWVKFMLHVNKVVVSNKFYDDKFTRKIS